MAPEQLEEVRDQAPGRVTERSDLFSLGVIFYELLTGQHPFPLSGQANKVAAALDLRRKRPPAVRSVNPNVSPAIEAVVHKLLEPDPARRYQSAEQLWTDLDRHAIHLPLLHTPEPSVRESFGKWRRRNPGVFRRAVLLCAALTVTVAGAWAYTTQQANRTAAAVDTVRRFRTDLATLRVDLTSPLDSAHHAPGVAKAIDWLAAFGVTDAGVAGWDAHPVMKRLAPDDRTALAADLGELAALVAIAERLPDRPADERKPAAARASAWYATATSCFRGQPLPAAIRDGHAAAAELVGEPAPVCDGPIDGDSPRAAFVRGATQFTAGRVIDATSQFERTARAHPDHFAAQFLLGRCFHDLFEAVRAQERFDMARSLAPADYRPAFNRGLSLSQTCRRTDADEEFSAAIDLAPTMPELYYQRAVIRARWKPAEALTDLDRAVDLGGLTPSILHVRAAVHNELMKRATTEEEKNRETALAAADRDALLRSEPKSAKDFAIRGFAILKERPAEALAALRKATDRNTKDFVSWYNQACVLVNDLALPDEAIAALDKAVDASPQFAQAILNRALIHARLGHRDAAIADAERGLKLGSPLPPSFVYNAGCVYAQTSKVEPRDADRAMTLLRRAAKEGFHNTSCFATDKDLDPVRDRADFQKLVQSIKELVQ
jgi:tetratricopeptide (TPR) repeat protein